MGVSKLSKGDLPVVSSERVIFGKGISPKKPFKLLLETEELSEDALGVTLICIRGQLRDEEVFKIDLDDCLPYNDIPAEDIPISWLLESEEYGVEATGSISKSFKWALMTIIAKQAIVEVEVVDTDSPERCVQFTLGLGTGKLFKKSVLYASANPDESDKVELDKWFVVEDED